MKYIRKKKEEKLYQQWVEHDELSPEAIPKPEKESSEDVLVSKDKVGKDKREQQLRILYVLFGFGIIMICLGLVLIIIQTC